MNSLSFAETHTRPLHTDADIEERVDSLVGHAIKRQLWALFTDDADLQRELIIPIDDLPVRPDDSVDYLISTLGEIIVMHGGGSLILVRERPGPGVLDRADLAWSEALRSACRNNGVTLRALLLSFDTGVRWLPETVASS